MKTDGMYRKYGKLRDGRQCATCINRQPDGTCLASGIPGITAPEYAPACGHYNVAKHAQHTSVDDRPQGAQMTIEEVFPWLSARQSKS